MRGAQSRRSRSRPSSRLCRSWTWCGSCRRRCWPSRCARLPRRRQGSVMGMPSRQLLVCTAGGWAHNVRSQARGGCTRAEAAWRGCVPRTHAPLPPPPTTAPGLQILDEVVAVKLQDAEGRTLVVGGRQVAVSDVLREMRAAVEPARQLSPDQPGGGSYDSPYGAQLTSALTGVLLKRDDVVAAALQARCAASLPARCSPQCSAACIPGPASRGCRARLFAAWQWPCSRDSGSLAVWQWACSRPLPCLCRRCTTLPLLTLRFRCLCLPPALGSPHPTPPGSLCWRRPRAASRWCCSWAWCGT